MPFISKDWRGPGEEWVKTDEGWEKKKVLECAGQLINKSEASTSNEKENVVPPHCHITIKCTKEIAGFNGLGEVVKRLDFQNAVRDVRRFNYVCALLDLLVGQQLTVMSGTAQKALLVMVEEVARHVSTSQQNLRVLRGLAAGLREARGCPRSTCWGGALGSQRLWKQHARAIQRILDTASELQIKEPGPDIKPKLCELPEECVREVLLRLSDDRDLQACVQVGAPLSEPATEQRLWRELAAFHFTPQQIDSVKPRSHWKDTYRALRRTYGIREDRQFAETLQLCRHCRCLFWRSLGHPCIADHSEEFRERLKDAGGPLAPRPVPPSDFLKFFSL